MRHAAARLALALALACCWRAAAALRTASPPPAPAAAPAPAAPQPPPPPAAGAAPAISGRALRQAPANASARYQAPYLVCTSDWAPIVRCADVEDTALFDGYQIALWRAIAADMGWADGDWTFACMDWSAMIDDLVSAAGNCSLAAAGVEVSLANIVAGLKFSWPIYKSGFHVLISSNVEAGGVWAFAQAFHWSVWLLLGATAVAVSVLITGAELLAHGAQANRKGMRGWSWYCMSKMVQVTPHVGDPKTWASRVLVLGYAFLVLIMVHLFTATTASKLTMQRLANDISSKADLKGKAVESWEPYVPLLRKYSIDATPLPWDNDADTEAMLANLRSHAYQALILDSPVVQYLAAQAPGCDLYPVGDPFETFNLAIAFPSDAPPQLAAAVSASIVRLQTTTALLDKLENTYIKASAPAGSGSSSSGSNSSGSSGGGSSGHGCANAAIQEGGHGSAGGAVIHLEQVLGLWYILLICAASALAITAATNLSRSARLRRRVLAALRCDWRGAAGAASGRVAAADARAPVSGAGAGKAPAKQQQQQPQQGDGSAGAAPASGADCEVRLAAAAGPGAAPKPTPGGAQPAQAAALRAEAELLLLPGAAASPTAAAPATARTGRAELGAQQQLQQRGSGLAQQAGQEELGADDEVLRL